MATEFIILHFSQSTKIFLCYPTVSSIQFIRILKCYLRRFRLTKLKIGITQVPVRFFPDQRVNVRGFCNPVEPGKSFPVPFSIVENGTGLYKKNGFCIKVIGSVQLYIDGPNSPVIFSLVSKLNSFP